jgi:hypothetical protein
MSESSGNTVSDYLNQAWTVASPFVQQFIFGGEREGDDYTSRDAQRYGRLNGAGAPNRAAAQGAPRSTLDLLFGTGGTAQVGEGGEQATRPNWVALAALAVVAWIVVKKL